MLRKQQASTHQAHACALHTLTSALSPPKKGSDQEDLGDCINMQRSRLGSERLAPFIPTTAHGVARALRTSSHPPRWACPRQAAGPVCS